jgi:aminopeptidase N
MDWWNDLWLNESFADFISHFCLSKIEIQSIPLGSIWTMFNSRKGWGYRTDEKSTTHPIAGVITNTEVAQTVIFFFNKLGFRWNLICERRLGLEATALFTR